MKNKINKDIVFSKKRVAFAGLPAFFLIVCLDFILMRIGPQPGGLSGVLRAPGLYGFCSYLTPIFHMVEITLYALCFMGGIYLGLVFRNKNLLSKKGISDLRKLRIIYGTVLITYIVFIGVLTVSYIFGFRSYNRLELIVLTAVILFGFAIGAIIAYRQSITNKIRSLF